MTFSIKPNVLSGDNSLEIIKDLNPGRILCVIDPFMKDNGMSDFLVDSLPKNSSNQIFSDVRPDPSQELVESASKAFLDYLPDMVIAMGHRCTPTNPGYLTRFDLENLLREIY